MADPRFFDNHGPFSLGTLAQAIGAELPGPSDASFEVVDVAPLENAGPQHLSFFDNPRYRLHFTQSCAGACIVSQANAQNLPVPAGMRLLIVKNAQIAYAKVATLFYPRATGAGDFEGLKPSLRGAHIHPSVKLGKGAIVDAGAVIAANVEIGAHTHISPGAVLGTGVVIGRDCIVGPQASITHSLIGDRVIIHPGARIGQDGFGFAPRAEGHLKVPQLGRVIIQDDVEIGANTTIDRGSGPDTVIGEGSKIDNLCQIAHNVKIGRGCFIVAQVGISGSVEIGDQVILAGQAATVGHVKIGDGAQIAARGGVTHDLAGGQAYGGYPARPLSEWKRELALVSRLSKKNSDSERDE